MPLVRCDIASAPHIVEAEPFCETRPDALFVPRSGAWAERGWGVYDAADRLVVAAARWLGDRPASDTWTAPDDALAAAIQPPDPGRVHVYAGSLEPGVTFFLDTVSRFWGRPTSGAGGTVLVFHAPGDVERFWQDPHAAEALAAFGIGPANCLVPEAPWRIPTLLVPAPSFVAGRLAHRAFGRVAATLGLRLAGERPTPGPELAPPVHVSHAREAAPAFPGEAALDAALATKGFVVLHPAEQALASIAAALADASLVTSTRPAGDVLAPIDLLCALAPGLRRIVIGADELAPLDSRLIDAVAEHRTTSYRIGSESPAILAHELVRIARRVAATEDLPCRLAGPVSRELGATLAGTASCIAAASGHADAVIGGLVSGQAQLRTERRQRPWWQVDWGIDVAVRGVRVHRPAAPDPEAAAGSVRVLGSFDGAAWHVLARRQAAASGPLVFRPSADEAAWRLRVLRVQAMGDGVLALDQVEIDGVPMIDAADGDGGADAGPDGDGCAGGNADLEQSEVARGDTGRAVSDGHAT